MKLLLAPNDQIVSASASTTLFRPKLLKVDGTGDVLYVVVNYSVLST